MPSMQPVTLAADEAAFLAARLRRLFAHFGYPLPEFADDDARLIGIAGSAISALLMNVCDCDVPAGVPGTDGGQTE